MLCVCARALRMYLYMPQLPSQSRQSHVGGALSRIYNSM